MRIKISIQKFHKQINETEFKIKIDRKEKLSEETGVRI